MRIYDINQRAYKRKHVYADKTCGNCDLNLSSDLTMDENQHRHEGCAMVERECHQMKFVLKEVR
jgi:hypothetical protein